MIRLLLLAGTFGIAGAALDGLLTPASAAPLCMSSGGKDAGAEGEIAVKTFTDKAGQAETVYILQLPIPICLSGPDKRDNVAPTKTMQIDSSDEAVRKTIADHVGKEILVIGRPYGARTPRHHAPIVMDVLRTIAD
jgi:hypothetical protein